MLLIGESDAECWHCARQRRAPGNRGNTEVPLKSWTVYARPRSGAPRVLVRLPLLAWRAMVSHAPLSSSTHPGYCLLVACTKSINITVEIFDQGLLAARLQCLREGQAKGSAVAGAWLAYKQCSFNHVCMSLLLRPFSQPLAHCSS